MGYSAAAPPPIVTVEAPRDAPKPLPQIVTQTPWFFCPPILGPLSRSEKKMRGGIVVVRLGADWARSPNEPARIIPITNKDANFMKGYLNTRRAERDRDNGPGEVPISGRGGPPDELSRGAFRVSFSMNGVPFLFFFLCC